MRGGKKLLKFIGRKKKGINCRIHYAASTVPRTAKVRQLVWWSVSHTQWDCETTSYEKKQGL